MRVWRINEGDNCVMRYALPVADIFMDADGMIGWRGCNGKLEGLERIGFLPEDVPARLLNDVKYFWRSREARSTLWVTSRLNQMRPNAQAKRPARPRRVILASSLLRAGPLERLVRPA